MSRDALLSIVISGPLFHFFRVFVFSEAQVESQWLQRLSKDELTAGQAILNSLLRCREGFAKKFIIMQRPVGASFIIVLLLLVFLIDSRGLSELLADKRTTFFQGLG